MAVKEAKLTVFAHLDEGWSPCGQLVLEEEGHELLSSTLAYGLNYLKRPDAIEVDPVNLALGDRERIRGQRLRPVNGLPFFGGIRDAAPDAWGRRVIEAKLRVPANSLPESQYLLHAGSERVGALDVRAGLDASPGPGVSSWHTLAHLMEAAERIEEGAPVPAHLEAIFMDGTALGGARPKASVRDDHGVLWLAKFASRQDRLDIPAIESASLRLAAEAGLTVPPVRTEVIGGRKVMLIRRFDRYWSTDQPLPAFDDDPTLLRLGPGAQRVERRLAFTSGLTWLACDETESRTKSYGDLAGAIRRHGHPTRVRADNTELFKRMVFNILVSNDDDHLRNHGFLLDPRLGGWRLSPLYDVMPRPGIAKERTLHLGVGPQGRAATLDNALAAHAAFTLSERDAAAAIDDVWRIVRQWRMHFESFDVEAGEIERIASAFRHLDEVSTAELRRKLP
jgi:serine/threonine-protein kinase HipA